MTPRRRMATVPADPGLGIRHTANQSYHPVMAGARRRPYNVRPPHARRACNFDLRRRLFALMANEKDPFSRQRPVSSCPNGHFSPAGKSSHFFQKACALAESAEQSRLRAEPALEHFQFETFRVSNHTAWRFAEKARFFRSLSAGRRCAAASHFAFFKGKML